MSEEGSKFRDLSDRELLDRYLADDGAICEEFCFRLNKMLHILVRQKAPAYGVNLRQHEPGDIVHNINVMLLEDDRRRLRRFGHRSSLYHWLGVIVSHVLIDLVRSKNFRQSQRTESISRKTSPDSDASTFERFLVDMGSDPYEQLAHKELIELLREAMVKCLSEEDQIVMVHWCLEYKEREIAAIMDMVEATVATRISRAKAAIWDYLEARVPDLLPKARDRRT